MSDINRNIEKPCQEGYHKRRSYRTSTGATVRASCVRSQTRYKESQADFQKGVARRKTQRLRSLATKIPRIRSISRKVCPPGMIERQPYVRKFTSRVRKQGYTVKMKTGKTYRVFPKAEGTYVKAKCIKDIGRPGKGLKAIGALRKGELKKHGYSSRKSEAQRHAALKKAIEEFGALGVFRKLTAVANYTVRTQPEKSRIYKADSEWIRNENKPLVVS